MIKKLKTYAVVKVSQKNLYETVLITVLALSALFFNSGYDIASFKMVWLAGLIGVLFPKLFYPLAWVLLFTGTLLGNISGRVSLSILFFLLICPVAILKRWLGKDFLQLKSFKKNTSSRFINRDYCYTKKDLLYSF